jgi:hypothetical protein
MDMEEQRYNQAIAKATDANEDEKAKQFSNMAQETVSALASKVKPADTYVDDQAWSLASKMILDGSDKTQPS